MSNQCVSTLFCMQNLEPNNFEFFVRPNSKFEIFDYPMIMLAYFLNTATNIQTLSIKLFDASDAIALRGYRF